MERRVRLVAINDNAFTDARWREYQRLHEKLHEQYLASLPASSWRELKARALSYLKKEPLFGHWVAIEGDELTAYVTLWLRNSDPPRQPALLWFDAAYDMLPETLGVAIAGQIVDWMDSHGCSQAFHIASDERTSHLAKAWNAALLNRLDEFVLWRSRANHGIIAEWLNDIPARHPGLRIECFDGLPSEHMDEFTELLNEMLSDMPREREQEPPPRADVESLKAHDEWRRANDLPSYKFILFSEQNQPIAYTSAEVRRSDPRRIHQLSTIVTKRYRGRGLARWLKAAMFNWLGEEFPENEAIVTEMRAVNKPIQAINSKMGFVCRRRGAEYRIGRQGFVEYISKSESRRSCQS